MNAVTQSAKVWMARLGLASVFGLAIIAALFLSAFFFALLLVLAAIGSLVFWWKTRGMRKRAAAVQREFEEQQAFAKGNIIEAEYRVEQQQDSADGSGMPPKDNR